MAVAPQGSILDLMLWNAVYNGVLTLKHEMSRHHRFRRRRRVDGNRKDTYLNDSMATVERSMTRVKLQIVHHQAEVLLISNF